MLYRFQCPGCDRVHEHRCTISERPDVLPCDCGQVAIRKFEAPQVLVRFKERDAHLDAYSLPIGWDRGNTGPAQERRYKKKLAETRALARKNDSAAIKGGIRHVASVPREWQQMRQRQFGKDYWQSDIKQKLKSDGLLFKDR